jgi:hypothetical protein
MRGTRHPTLVPSLSVATSSATGTGLSDAAYFGFAIENDGSFGDYETPDVQQGFGVVWPVPENPSNLGFPIKRTLPSK